MKGVTGCQVNFVATVVKRVAKECSVLSIAITNSPVRICHSKEVVYSIILFIYFFTLSSHGNFFVFTVLFNLVLFKTTVFL